jgi:murein DD-endopeptidase MepM/ murein hydrolase activator NlpD
VINCLSPAVWTGQTTNIIFKFNYTQLREQMTQRQKSAQKNLYYSSAKGLTPSRRFASTLPAQSLCWLSSVSLLSGGLVFAQETSVDNIIPTIENSQPAATNSVPKAGNPVIVHTSAQNEEKPESVVHISHHKTEKSANTPVVQISHHKTENPVTESENSSITFSNKSTGEKQDYNNAYIDPTDYSSGAANGVKKRYQAPDSVVVTERSSGCHRTISAGSGVSSSSCAKSHHDTNLADVHHHTTPSWLKKSADSHLATLPSSEQQETVSTHSNSQETGESHVNHQHWRISRTIAQGETPIAYRLNRFMPGPNEFVSTNAHGDSIGNGINASATESSIGTLPTPVIEGNVAPRPSTVAYDFSLAAVLPQVSDSGTTVAYQPGSGMIFPLSIPAPVTSLFGWRIHPITGERRFHAGTDLGAPVGTPVLAAARGQVETADWMGGYGLAVIINHNSAEQSLYGHMSQIFVHPGQWVEPGTVIGQVGSTGFSTGPHLHFEIRHLTQDGWVAVDPGTKLQTALGQLTQSLRTAQLPQ